MKNVARDNEYYLRHRSYFAKVIEWISNYVTPKNGFGIKEFERKILEERQIHNPLHVTTNSMVLKDSFNSQLENLLNSYLVQLNSLIEGQSEENSDIKGAVREGILGLIMNQFFPPHCRTGNGEIIDQFENRSGQCDIVIEYPFFPSIPFQSGLESRLYISEGVAFVIEAKSNFSDQFSQIVSKAGQILALKPKVGSVFSAGIEGDEFYPPETNIYLGSERYSIPFYVISYDSKWSVEKIQSKMQTHNYIQGVLIIKDQVYISQYYKNQIIDGPMSLWAMISEFFMDLRVSSFTAHPHSYMFKNP